jgi:hypothetical protein
MTDAFAAVREEIEAMRTCTAQAAEGYENDDRDAGPLWGRVDALDALLRFMNGDPRFTGVASAKTPAASPLGAALPSVASREAYEREVSTTLSPGCRVRYAHPGNGRDDEARHAAESLTLGEVYTVTSCEVGQSVTDLGLEGTDGHFNSVLFEPVAVGDLTGEEGPQP